MNWQNTLIGYFFNAIRYGAPLGEASRELSFWQKLLGAERSSVSEEMPWISIPAFRFLEKSALSSARVFEFGGGGSTLWFLKKIGASGQLFTVEHDEHWMQILRTNIAQRGYSNWEGRFVAAEKLPDGQRADAERPDGFGSKDPSFEGFSFKKYATAISDFPDEHFDLVLVDGRSRVSCIAQSLSKIKRGGLLVIDNAERAYYLEPFRAIFERDFEAVNARRGPTMFHPSWTITLVLRKK